VDIAHPFSSLPDPRHPAFRDYHVLSDILVIALAEVLSGAKSWDAIAAFGRTKEPWLRSLGLPLPHGIPAHDTFNRIFAALDPLAFQRCFPNWMNAVARALGWRHLPIDGKAVRGRRGPDGTCLHLVRAWAAPHRLTLAQVAVRDKSNEITAIPELLALLQLRGALVRIDALGCQKDIAQQIRAHGGNYLLGLKDNQPTLKADVEACFRQAYETDFAGLKHDSFRTEEVGHGRHEERVYRVLYQPSGLSPADEWVALKAVVQVIRTRRQGEQERTEVSYYLSSSTAAAAVLAEGIRGHWGIENGQHWCLDVLFSEDGWRTRQGNAAQNLAWLRQMALALLRHDDRKGSIPTKQLRAALSDDYRTHLLHLLGE
jgi:predicted transposase YbfD/YdcC